MTSGLVPKKDAIEQSPKALEVHVASRPSDSPASRFFVNDLPKEDLLCPICQDLLVKPVVNACGHSFCFWCTHRAMDPLARSSCPLCRAELEHFPLPCAPLYHIATRFFDEVTERAKEISEQEMELKAGSVQIAIEPGRPAEFRCQVCGEHVRRGLVSVCGHLFCSGCFPSDPNKAVCPCGSRLIYRPKPCQLLLSITGDEGACDACPVGGEVERLPSLPPTTRASIQDCFKSLAVWNLRAPAPKQLPYVHFGVGCDACGVYPISGRAFRCRDCPDQVGFDLCADCHTLHRGEGYAGRFGQAHTKDHSME